MERKLVSFNLNSRLHDELKKLSKKTGIPMSRLVDMGIELLIKEKEGK